jgi:hypothetical protein
VEGPAVRRLSRGNIFRQSLTNAEGFASGRRRTNPFPGLEPGVRGLQTGPTTALAVVNRVSFFDPVGKKVLTVIHRLRYFQPTKACSQFKQAVMSTFGGT